MSRYSDFKIKGINAKTPIGTPIYVLAGDPLGGGLGIQTTLEDGRYVRTGQAYLKSEYPQLFEKIGQIYSNGISWSGVVVVPTTGTPTNSIAFGNNTFVTGGASGEIFTSTDNAVSWVPRTSGTTLTINAVVYGLDKFVVGANGGQLRTSTNGVSWYTRTSGTTSNILSLTYANGLYVYAGAGGVLRTSTNGVNWTARSSGTTSSILAITYGNGQYVIAGTNGMLRTSTDGVTWITRTSGTASTINALAYGNGVFAMAGAGGLLRTSTDAVTWQTRTSGTTSEIRSIIYGKGIFIYGAQNVTGTSIDGSSWATQSSTTALLFTDFRFNAIAFNDSWYVGVGGNPTLNPRSYRSPVTCDLETEFFVPGFSQTNPSRASTGAGFTPSNLVVYLRAKEV